MTRARPSLKQSKVLGLVNQILGLIGFSGSEKATNSRIVVSSFTEKSG